MLTEPRRPWHQGSPSAVAHEHRHTKCADVLPASELRHIGPEMSAILHDLSTVQLWKPSGTNCDTRVRWCQGLPRVIALCHHSPR